MATRQELKAARDARDIEIASAFRKSPVEVRTLAMRFHVSESTVRRALRAANIDTQDEEFAPAMELAKAQRIMPEVAILYVRHDIERIAVMIGCAPRVVRAAVVLAIQNKLLTGPFAELV